MYFREMKVGLPQFAYLATTCYWQQLGTEIKMTPIFLYCLTWSEFIGFTNRCRNGRFRSSITSMNVTDRYVPIPISRVFGSNKSDPIKTFSNRKARCNINPTLIKTSKDAAVATATGADVTPFRMSSRFVSTSICQSSNGLKLVSAIATAPTDKAISSSDSEANDAKRKLSSSSSSNASTVSSVWAVAS